MFHRRVVSKIFFCLSLKVYIFVVFSQVRATCSTPLIATIDWIVVKEFYPLLLTRQTGGFTRVGQPLNMRARIPEQWQNNYDVFKSRSTTDRTGIQPEKHWLLAKCHSASANLSSQVTVFACRQKNPPTDLSFINQGLNHLFYQEQQIWVEPTFFVSIRRKSLQTNLLSSYDDDDDDDDDDDEGERVRLVSQVTLTIDSLNSAINKKIVLETFYFEKRHFACNHMFHAVVNDNYY